MTKTPDTQTPETLAEKLETLRTVAHAATGDPERYPCRERWSRYHHALQAAYEDGHLVVRPDAEPTPEQGWRPISAEERLASDILAELVRARMKFPGKNVTFAALVEEVGELATATFEESRDCVRREAVQVAVMAMRMVLDGDHCFDAWREDKGLDPLLPPAPTEEG